MVGRFQVDRQMGRIQVDRQRGWMTVFRPEIWTAPGRQGGEKYATCRKHRKRLPESQKAREKSRGSDCKFGQGAGRSLLNVSEQGPQGPFQKGGS